MLLESSIFATKGNKINKGLIMCYEKPFPCLAFGKNRRKRPFYKQTRGNFYISCEWDPVKIWYSDDFFLLDNPFNWNAYIFVNLYLFNSVIIIWRGGKWKTYMVDHFLLGSPTETAVVGWWTGWDTATTGRVRTVAAGAVGPWHRVGWSAAPSYRPAVEWRRYGRGCSGGQHSKINNNITCLHFVAWPRDRRTKYF